MLSDILLILYSWVIFGLLHGITFPFIARKLHTLLADAGWGISRSFGWLLVALPVWYLSHLGIPLNTKPGVWSVLILCLLASAYSIAQNRDELRNILKKIKPYILTQELLFAFGLLFLSVVRSYNPDINGLEKFMDGGLIISYQKSATLPLQDMWLAGYTFNYYTFGHFMGSIITFLLGIPVAKSYNILLGFMMGLTMILSGSFVMNALVPFREKKGRVFPILLSGGIAAYVVAFAGNTQTAWYFLKNRKFEGYWYPDATRFIERTIHEFPSYSFIVSDLHAHVWNLSNALTLLTLIGIWVGVLSQTKKGFEQKISNNYLFLSAAMGLLMGVLTMTSTWDALVYALFFGLTSLILLAKNYRLFYKIFITGFIIVVTMLISSSPWWLNFDSISEGAAIATEKSPIWQLLTLWIGHAGVGIVAASTLIYLYLKKKLPTTKGLLILGMILTGLSLLILPEFFYMKDIYLTQPRANTMFKLTYQGFIFLSITMSWFFGYLLVSRTLHKVIQFGLYMIVGVVILTIGIYPYFGYRDYYGLKITTTCENERVLCPKFTGTYKGLDGVASWLEIQEPGDYAAILWLQKNVDGQPHILEAVGDSYTTFARISTFSGLPTVLGWRVHEWLWRGSYDLAGQRSGEVESIYIDPLTENSQRLLNEYQVEYVIVGNKEREAYPTLQLPQLKKLGRVVFEKSDTIIIQRDL